MKKLFIATAFLFAVQFASAQTNDAFKKDVIEYVKLSGSSVQVTAALEPMMNQLQISDDKKADLRKDIDATLPDLYEKIADVMMKYYTHDDVKKMIEFYNSPVGKKIQEVAPKLTKDQMQASQEWGMQLQGIVMKYMQ